jgi:hypothetical protein
MNLNSILLRRKNKMFVPTSALFKHDKAFVATFNLNLQSLGYTLSPECIDELQHTAPILFINAIETLKTLRGDRKYQPMYPNFPKQVMDASRR